MTIKAALVIIYILNGLKISSHIPMETMAGCIEHGGEIAKFFKEGVPVNVFCEDHEDGSLHLLLNAD